MTDKQRQAIEKHGNDLNAIFNTGIEPIKLCKLLRRIETNAHRMAEDYANGVINDKAALECTQSYLQDLDNILHYKKARIPIIINTDPRGYALKIPVHCVLNHKLNIMTDWGGDGIIAPGIGKDGN